MERYPGPVVTAVNQGEAINRLNHGWEIVRLFIAAEFSRIILLGFQPAV